MMKVTVKITIERDATESSESHEFSEFQTPHVFEADAIASAVSSMLLALRHDNYAHLLSGIVDGVRSDLDELEFDSPFDDEFFNVAHDAYRHWLDISMKESEEANKSAKVDPLPGPR